MSKSKHHVEMCEGCTHLTKVFDYSQKHYKMYCTLQGRTTGYKYVGELYKNNRHSCPLINPSVRRVK